MSRFDAKEVSRPARPADSHAPPRGRALLIASAGVALICLAYHAFTWRSFTKAVDAFTVLFSDFVNYYYPMGAAIFQTELPVEGFLYSPFVALLMALFPPLGITASLVLWGILQIFFVLLYIILFRKLVPVGAPVQLLFIALVLSSFPLLLNFIGGSVSVFMIVGLLGLLVLYERGRNAAAAGLFAFAVSFKFFPFIFIAPFAASRNARFLLFMTAACFAFLIVIPSVFLGGGDTLRFYGALIDSFRDSGWVVGNPHSQYFPHLVIRLANEAGYSIRAHLPLLRWIGYGFAALNLGLLIMVQRSRLRFADLWSFHIVFLTIPFVLKTSWPHDFVFLSFTQASLAWWLLEGGRQAVGIDTVETGAHGDLWRERRLFVRGTVALLLLASIVFSNIVFFNHFVDFISYGFLGFIFWADLFLLIAVYIVLLPPALRIPRHHLADTVRLE